MLADRGHLKLDGAAGSASKMAQASCFLSVGRKPPFLADFGQHHHMGLFRGLLASPRASDLTVKEISHKNQLISEVTYHHFCHVLLVRQTNHCEGKGWTEDESQAGGISVYQLADHHGPPKICILPTC